MSIPNRPSSGWVWINIGLIVVSVGVILLPQARYSVLFRIVLGLVVGPAYFIMLIRETRKTGLGDAPMHRLAADARKGRRVRLNALEFAATAAFVLALLNPFGG